MYELYRYQNAWYIDTNLKYPDRYSKNTKTSKLMKFLAVGAELFHAE